MRVLSLLLALVPCAALATQEAPEAPSTPGEAAATGLSEHPERSAPPARGVEGPATSTPTAPEAAVEDLPLPPPPPPATAPFPRWGLFLGAGVPEGATLSLIYRPVPYLRLHAGPSWGYLKFGYHGGLTISPIRWAISPVLGFEAGRYSSINVASAVKDTSTDVAPLLRNVNVTYAAALLGFEIGSQRGFSFDLRVGLTWLKLDSKGTGTFTGAGGTVGGGTTTNDATIKVTNPTLRASAPTVQLGFQYFF